jgi:hypothetical protein
MATTTLSFLFKGIFHHRGTEGTEKYQKGKTENILKTHLRKSNPGNYAREKVFVTVVLKNFLSIEIP